MATTFALPPRRHDPSLLDVLSVESIEQFEAQMTQLDEYGDAYTSFFLDSAAASALAESLTPAAPSSSQTASRSHRPALPPAAATTSASASSTTATATATVTHGPGSLSLSPADASCCLTPASTIADSHDAAISLDELDSDHISNPTPSPLDSPIDGYVYVEGPDVVPGGAYHRLTGIWPPLHSGTAHDAPATPASYSARYPVIARQLRASHGLQWSFPDTSMNDTFDDQYTSASSDFDYVGGALSSEGSVGTRALPDLTQPHALFEIPPQQHDDGYQHIGYNENAMFVPTSNFDLLNQNLMQQYQPYDDFPPAQHDFAYGQAHFNHPNLQPSPLDRTLTSRAERQPPRLTSNAAVHLTRHHAIAPDRQHQHRAPQLQPLRVAPQYSNQAPTSRPSPTMARTGEISPSDSNPGAFGQHQRPIKLESHSSSRGPRRGGAANLDRVRKGGRPKNSHLNETSRNKSHNMRKVGACWRCAMQRDPCDNGDPCGRCLMHAQKGQTYFFECDRSKLPDLVHEFLPPSFTLFHQKQSIEDTVSAEVMSWDQSNSMDVYMSTGYGPPMRWKLYEFRPRTQALLSQLQYKTDPNTLQSTKTWNYSPPLGLLKIDTSDDAHFEAYLDQLLKPQHLTNFAWKCYEDDARIDPGQFQFHLLQLMCSLYIDTKDTALQHLLRDILRMMILTYIMGHTITIVDGTVFNVLSSIRHTKAPSDAPRHTSPRLANRQLKFFFSILRGNIYEKLLKWQQATLHTAGKKDETWLQSFCVILGFAMVLEEIQITLQVMADCSIERREMEPEQAQRQAFNACERIDTRFNLLIGLFQCKYRDRRWGVGSFGPSTPEMREPVQGEFLKALRRLVQQRRGHLQDRQRANFSLKHCNLYTSRLTAKFLLPFLALPAS